MDNQKLFRTNSETSSNQNLENFFLSLKEEEKRDSYRYSSLLNNESLSKRGTDISNLKVKIWENDKSDTDISVEKKYERSQIALFKIVNMLEEENTKVKKLKSDIETYQNNLSELFCKTIEKDKNLKDLKLKYQNLKSEFEQLEKDNMDLKNSIIEVNSFVYLIFLFIICFSFTIYKLIILVFNFFFQK